MTEDTTDAAFLDAKLRQLAVHAFVRLRADGQQIRTVTVKLRYTDMDEHQGQMSLNGPPTSRTTFYPLLFAVAQAVVGSAGAHPHGADPALERLPGFSPAGPVRRTNKRGGTWPWPARPSASDTVPRPSCGPMTYC